MRARTDAEVHELWLVGKRAHPRVALDAATFAAHFSTHAAAETSALAAHAADLFLACACAAGDAAAIDTLERDHMRRVPDFVARVDASSVFADEVKQHLRERLLLRDGDRAPRIAEYSGAGPLDAWLRVASVRAARNMKRDGAAAERRGARRSEAPPPPGPTPELEYLKARHGRDIGDAFAAVLARLPDKDKSLLMMHFVDGQSTAAIAAVHRVHPATVRRWINQLRTDILKDAKRDLRARFGTGEVNMTSLMDLVQSELDISLTRVLRQRT